MSAEATGGPRPEPYAPGNAPRLYRVRLVARSGREATYRVCTWMGPDRAIAIARDAHPTVIGSPVARAVAIDDGPAQRDGNGVFVIPGDCLDDRSEW